MSALSPPKVLVPERGTRLRRAAVLTSAGPGECHWVRWEGPDAPTPLGAVPDALEVALRHVRTPAGSRVVTGQAWHGARRYRMPGPQSIAEEIVVARGERCGVHADAVAELGRLVRRLHDVRDDPALPAHPPALDRLLTWLSGPPLDARHGAVREVVRTRLGEHRWELLSRWLDELLDPARPRVVAHGWLGLGQCAADPARSSVALVAGEDLGRAPWYADIGWVAGQLLELRHFLGTDANRSGFQDLLDAWWEGYGTKPDMRVQQAAVLDVALHVHDFSAYFTVADREPAAWADLLCGLVDDPAW